MSEKEQLVLNAAVLREDNRKILACQEALRLSREHDISLKEIGDTCNRNGIKIVECQLGCFT